MYFRFILILLLTVTLEHSSLSAPLFPLREQTLQMTAEALKARNYLDARDSAIKAPNGPIRNFLLGVASYRLGKWEETVNYLATSEKDFALLADYALYYRADALTRLARYNEALELLEKLKKNYPASPLSRAVNSLYADTLFNKKDYQGALSAYETFIEMHPSGKDALKASLQAALCREAMGDKENAVSELRSIWINYPNTPVATQAESNLQRLKSENVPVPPFTTDEMFKRGSILYDRRKYNEALVIFEALSRQSLTNDLTMELAFKTAQTLFKFRRYTEAEQAFTKLATCPDKKISYEAAYWLARTLDKTGKEQQAIASYLKLVDSFPKSELADDALFHAALLNKTNGEHPGANILLDRLIDQYPSSVFRSRAFWEKAWTSYLAKNYKTAANCLNQLLDFVPYREKALYWLGKAEEASGDKASADAAFARLVEDYPFGFYTQWYKKDAGLKNVQLPSLDIETVSSTPLPSGYDRAKALISLGLFDEAGMELSAIKRKGVGKSRVVDLARLYWEIKDYHSALGCFPKVDRNNLATWGFSYPIVFRESITRCAADYGIPESLAYSIIRAESRFSPTALSPVGAVGLMQIMPSTAKKLASGKSIVINKIRLTSPDLNISLGLKHFKNLLVRFNGKLVPAVAAYNSGATPVDRWLKMSGTLRNDEFIENIPYPETREYVKNVLTNMELYNSLYNLEKPTGNTASDKSPSSSFSGPFDTSLYQETDRKSRTE
jgi:soluble lytic murein transglycosylase